MVRAEGKKKNLAKEKKREKRPLGFGPIKKGP